MKIGRYILLGAVVAVCATIGIKQYRKRHITVLATPANASAIPLPESNDSAYNTRAPDGTRIKVEVLNASDRRGLARRATLYLRDRGFDVVLIGGTKDRFDRTVVYDRTGNAKWAQLVAKAFNGTVESRPDTSRYVDVTVLIGKSWTPPPQPFYP